jgi:serine/threonine-protein kinase
MQQERLTAADMIGSMVGQYRIVDELGEGGMGVVYKAVDTMIDREVAIKMLRPEIARQPNLLDRFRSEAVTVAKLNHSGIATLYSFAQQGENFFMVMEYVPGKTLETIEHERGALSWQIAVPLAAKILEAIQPAHEMGIVHRDIKPANIMLTTWGTIKVMDFGISRMVAAPRMTTEGRVIGTIEYISPERIKGQPSDARSDIYSLGVVLFEMLANRLPFQSQSEFDLMEAHLHDPVPALCDMGCDAPPAVEEVLHKAMAKAPDDRYQSCDAFAAALTTASGNLTIAKKDVVDLVGAVAVREMGTAGHQFTPGEMPNMAAPRTVSGPAPAAGPAAAAPVSRFSGWVPRLRKNWQIAAAMAFVLLSVGIGVFAGLARRSAQKVEGNNPQQPPAIQPQPAPPPAEVPVSDTPSTSPPANSVPSPPPQIISPVVPPSGGSPKQTTGSKETQRKKALKALNE